MSPMPAILVTVMLIIDRQIRRLPPKRRRIAIGMLEFIKLQLAGNIPLLGTFSTNFLLLEIIGLPGFISLLSGTILSYLVFFYVSDRWVFSYSRKSRHSKTNAIRFVIFMSMTAAMTFLITWNLSTQLGVSVHISQFISAAISITWTFPGMKFWVFAPTKSSNNRTRRKAAARPRKKLA